MVNLALLSLCSAQDENINFCVVSGEEPLLYSEANAYLEIENGTGSTKDYQPNEACHLFKNLPKEASFEMTVKETPAAAASGAAECFSLINVPSNVDSITIEAEDGKKNQYKKVNGFFFCNEQIEPAGMVSLLTRNGKTQLKVKGDGTEDGVTTKAKVSTSESCGNDSGSEIKVELGSPEAETQDPVTGDGSPVTLPGGGASTPEGAPGGDAPSCCASRPVSPDQAGIADGPFRATYRPGAELRNSLERFAGFWGSPLADPDNPAVYKYDGDFSDPYAASRIQNLWLKTCEDVRKTGQREIFDSQCGIKAWSYDSVDSRIYILQLREGDHLTQMRYEKLSEDVGNEGIPNVYHRVSVTYYLLDKVPKTPVWHQYEDPDNKGKFLIGQKTFDESPEAYPTELDASFLATYEGLYLTEGSHVKKDLSVRPIFYEERVLPDGRVRVEISRDPFTDNNPEIVTRITQQITIGGEVNWESETTLDRLVEGEVVEREIVIHQKKVLLNAEPPEDGELEETVIMREFRGASEAELELVSESTKVYLSFTRDISDTREDPIREPLLLSSSDGGPHATIYHYRYDEEQSALSGYIAGIEYPDGTWVHYGYQNLAFDDSFDIEVRPFGDEAFPVLDDFDASTATLAELEPYHVTVDSHVDSSEYLTTEYIGGQQVSKTGLRYDLCDDHDDENELYDYGCTTTKRYFADGEDDYLRSIVEHFVIEGSEEQDPTLDGKLRRIIHSDGTMETYDYAYGFFHGREEGWLAAGNRSFKEYLAYTDEYVWDYIDDDGNVVEIPTDLRTLVIQGTAGSPSGLTEQTTIRITYEGLDGKETTSRTRLYQDGGGVQVVGEGTAMSVTDTGLQDLPLLSSSHFVEYEDDDENQISEQRSNGRLVSKNIRSANRSESISLGGGRTVTEYDEQGSFESSTVYHPAPGVPATRVEYAYNGRTTTTTRTWVQNSGNEQEDLASVSTVTTSDLIGRLESQVSGTGLVTSYAYPTRFETEVSVAGELVRREESSPSAYHRLVYSAGDQGDGVFAMGDDPVSSSSREQDDNGDIVQTTWQLGGPERSVTFDQLGNILTSTALGLTTTYSYDAFRRVEKVQTVEEDVGEEEQTAVLPPTLTVYDALGRVWKHGTDRDGDGALTAGSDYFTETLSSYQEIDGAWWRQQVVNLFHSSDGVPIVTTSRSRESFPPNSGIVSQSFVQRGDGSSVLTTREIDPDTGVEVLTINDSNFTRAVKSVSIGAYPISQQDPQSGKTIFWQYGIEGGNLVTSQTDLRGGLSKTATNILGQTTYTQNQLGEKTNYSYYTGNIRGSGQLSSTTNAENEVVSYTYSPLGQVLTTEGSGAYPMQYGYDAAGRMTHLTTQREEGEESITRWFYHPDNGKLAHKIYNYDPTKAPNEAFEISPGVGTSYLYDSYGRLTDKMLARRNDYNPDSAAERLTISYDYDEFGNLTLISDNEAAGADRTSNVDFRNFDLSGRPREVHMKGQGQLDLAYDPLGRFTSSESYQNSPDFGDSVLDGLKLTREEVANAAGFASRTMSTKVWNNASVLSTNQRNSLNGRLTSQNITMTLGAANVSASNTIESYYEGTGVPRSRTVTLNGHGVTHHQLLNLGGRLKGISTKALGGQQETLSWVSYSHDRVGRRLSATREDRTKWSYSYNDRGEVTGASKALADATLLPGHQFTYQYDDIGNREIATYGGGIDGANPRTISYSPNALNQYTESDGGGSLPIIGLAPEDTNILVAHEIGGTPKTTDREGPYFFAELIAEDDDGQWREIYISDDAAITADDQRGAQWIEPFNPFYRYDADGNLVADSRWEYRWDANNRLVWMRTAEYARVNRGHPDLELRFTYDHQGRRIRKEVTNRTNPQDSYDRRFLYDAWNLVAEFNWVANGSSGTVNQVASHQWGNDLSGSSQRAGGVGGLLFSCTKDSETGQWAKLIPSFDGNGNIIAWSKDGNLVQKNDYDAFGNTLTTYSAGADLAENPFGFSTKYEDVETGLLYYGYRYYDPVTGRWPSKDPIGERGGMNLYGMVGNDAVNRVDLLGMTGLGNAHSAFQASLWKGYTEAKDMPSTKHGHGKIDIAMLWLILHTKGVETVYDPSFATGEGSFSNPNPHYGIGGDPKISVRNAADLSDPLTVAIHEATHVFHGDRTGSKYAWNGRRNEGRAYAMEAIFSIHREFAKMWERIEVANARLGDNCPEFARVVQDQWREFSEYLSYDRYPVGSGHTGSIDSRDVGNIEDGALGASFSCNQVQQIMNNKFPGLSGCCISVSCIKGPKKNIDDNDFNFNAFTSQDEMFK